MGTSDKDDQDHYHDCAWVVFGCLAVDILYSLRQLLCLGCLIKRTLFHGQLVLILIFLVSNFGIFLGSDVLNWI